MLRPPQLGHTPLFLQLKAGTRPRTFRLLAKVSVEETRDLSEYFFRLRSVWRERILRVRHPFEYLQRGFHSCLTQLAVSTHSVAQKKVTRAASQDRGRETVEVAVDW